MGLALPTALSVSLTALAAKRSSCSLFARQRQARYCLVAELERDSVQCNRQLVYVESDMRDLRMPVNTSVVDVLTPLDSSIGGKVAPMPRQWLQRVASPQTWRWGGVIPSGCGTRGRRCRCRSGGCARSSAASLSKPCFSISGGCARNVEYTYIVYLYLSISIYICIYIHIHTYIVGFRVSGFGFRVSGFGFRVSGFGFRVSGFGFRVSGFGFRVSGFGFQVSGIGFRISGLGLRVKASL